MSGKIDGITEKKEENMKPELELLAYKIMRVKLDFYQTVMIKLTDLTSADQRTKWDSFIEIIFDGLYDDIIEFHEMSVAGMKLLGLASDPSGSKSP